METKSKSLVINIVTVLGSLLMLATIYLAFVPTSQTVAAWFPAYLVAFGVAGLVAYYGIWQMKEWGLWALAALFVINNIVDVVVGVWTMWILIIPVVILGVLVWQMKFVK